MRLVKFISVHCTDTQNPDHDNIKTIREWHTDPKRRGGPWIDVGYHFFIRSNGTIEVGRPIWMTPAAVEGHNKDMVAVAFHGRDKDKFTPEQFDSGAKLILMLMRLLNVNLHNVLGHNHWNKGKACPSFDVKVLHDKITDLID